MRLCLAPEFWMESSRAKVIKQDKSNDNAKHYGDVTHVLTDTPCFLNTVHPSKA